MWSTPINNPLSVLSLYLSSAWTFLTFVSVLEVSGHPEGGLSTIISSILECKTGCTFEFCSYFFVLLNKNNLVSFIKHYKIEFTGESVLSGKNHFTSKRCSLYELFKSAIK